MRKHGLPKAAPLRSATLGARLRETLYEADMSIESIKENIEKCGWQFQFVFDENGEKEDFSYSIGFEESFSHPEIMIFGLKRETMKSIMSDIAEDLKKGRTFEEGVKIGDVLAGDYEVCFKYVKEEFHPEYAGMAVSYYNKKFRIMVMFWPDKNNVLPIESSCELTIQNEALQIV